MLYEALLYDELTDQQVQCNLCNHRCVIREGKRGFCRVRENHDGKLMTMVYGNLISKNIDPIEKKPLYHFFPSSMSFSIAMPGCNFNCEWCQNWQISQMPKLMDLPFGQRVMPDAVVKSAYESGCQSISYTYTEPTIFFEYSLDTAKLAKDKGLLNVFVTNGYMTPEMLEVIQPYLDAANVDIKAFKEDTYRKLMGGSLKPVLESCRIMKAMGVWLEITTLIVPGVNDDPAELEALAKFIHQDLGAETPWHLSRFYPQYKMINSAPTSESILFETKETAEKIGLKYVYIGNLFGRDQTCCKNCGFVLISRNAYTMSHDGVNSQGRCINCRTLLDGVGVGQLGKL